ncbi:hypothetical protein Aduo_010008 [Ancylostoma duodenale]
MWLIVVAVIALCALTEAGIVHKIPSYAEEVEQFYQIQDKKAEEMENKTIAVLQNAAKAYREYLALFDDSKTLEQIDKEKKKLRSEKPKKEVENFYQTQDKEAEEMENKTIAVLEGAAKAYREYLALFDDSKTLEQIEKEDKKLRSEKPKEYNVFMYASGMMRTLNENPNRPRKFQGLLSNSWP